MDLTKIKKTKGAFSKKRPFFDFFVRKQSGSGRFDGFLAQAAAVGAQGQFRFGGLCRFIPFRFHSCRCHGGIAVTVADKEALIEIFQRDIGLFADAVQAVAILLFRRVAAVMVMLVLLLLVTVLFFRQLVQQALVMFGMLQIAFRQHAIAPCLRVARQRQVFFGDLHGIAADADIGPVAVKGVYARVDPACAVMAVAAMAVIVTATKTSSVLIVSHMTHFAFVSCVPVS